MNLLDEIILPEGWAEGTGLWDAVPAVTEPSGDGSPEGADSGNVAARAPVTGVTGGAAVQEPEGDAFLRGFES